MSEQNKELPAEDWWTIEQIKFAKDKSRLWKKKHFEPSDGFWIIRDGKTLLGKVSEHEELPSDAVIEKKSWDHEHCFLCSVKISDFAEDLQFGYFDGHDWICKECYEKYINPGQI